MSVELFCPKDGLPMEYDYLVHTCQAGHEWTSDGDLEDENAPLVLIYKYVDEDEDEFLDNHCTECGGGLVEGNESFHVLGGGAWVHSFRCVYVQNEYGESKYLKE